MHTTSPKKKMTERILIKKILIYPTQRKGKELGLVGKRQESGSA